MSIFTRKDPEPVVTGVDILRRTCKARDHKGGALLAIVREVDGLAITTLEAFAAGKTDLSVALLQKLTKVLYPHSEYDPELNLLRSANRQAPKLAGIAPLPFDPNSVTYPPRADPKARSYMDPGPPMIPSQVQATKRPGWL